MKFKKQNGMTLLELVIGITLAMMIMIFAFEQFMPWLSFRQKFMTELKLNEMQESLKGIYFAKSMYIDNTNTSGGAPDYPYVTGATTESGKIFLESDIATAPSLESSCDDPIKISSNKSTLSKYLGNPDADFGRDAYGNDLCIVVTKANILDTGAIKLYYHTILIISRGKNGLVDTKVNLDDGTFTARDPEAGETEVFNDDMIRVVNGFEIERNKFDLALKRLENTASIFESYFQIQFLTDIHRDLLKNYFSSNPSVTGMASNLYAPYDISIIESPSNSYIYQDISRDPVVQTAWTQVFSKLGLGLDDIRNPWISCFGKAASDCKNDFMTVLMTSDSTNTSLDTEIYSAGLQNKVRTPGNSSQWYTLPPYNVLLVMDYPGRLDPLLNPNGQFLTKAAHSKY